MIFRVGFAAVHGKSLGVCLHDENDEGLVPVIMAQVPRVTNPLAPCLRGCPFYREGVETDSYSRDDSCGLDLSVPHYRLVGYCSPGEGCPGRIADSEEEK